MPLFFATCGPDQLMVISGRYMGKLQAFVVAQHDCKKFDCLRNSKEVFLCRKYSLIKVLLASKYQIVLMLNLCSIQFYETGYILCFVKFKCPYGYSDDLLQILQADVFQQMPENFKWFGKISAEFFQCALFSSVCLFIAHIYCS